MLTTVLHLVRNGQPSSIRRFATSARLYDASRSLRATKIIEKYGAETHEPIWRLLNALQSGRGLQLSEALYQHGVSVEEFRQWKPMLVGCDIATAVSTMQKDNYVIRDAHLLKPSDDNPVSRHIPSWVALYLAGFKVRTTAHANGPLVSLYLSHYNTASPSVQAPLLVLSMLHMTRFSLMIPMARIIETFVVTPFPNEALHFNMLLYAMGVSRTSSVQLANMTVTLLKTMEARQLKLRSDTYHSLLKDRFVTLQLTKYLQQKMVREGFVPKVSHLEQYLRVFAKHGAIHDAQKYFDAIHAHPDLADKVSADSHKNPFHRANTLFLGAHDDRASAFNFLRTLAGGDEALGTARHPSEKRVSRFVHKRNPDIFEYTAALSVASRDLSTSAKRLIKVFERISARPTIVTHTILIRGLVLRKAYDEALEYWDKLVKTGLPIDKEALTVGVQALIHSGKPHVAFETLEKYAGISTGTKEEFKLFKPVVLSIISMNEILAAFNETARPDMVFRLWDHMGELYNVLPNSTTLSILLESARVASKLDESIRGHIRELVSNLAMRNILRKQVEPPKLNRDEIVASIFKVIRKSDGSLRRYESGTWNGRLPFLAVREIFIKAVFGSSKNPEALLALESPADYIRTSINEDPAFGFPNIKPIKYEFKPPPNILDTGGKPHYPSIIVDTRNFLNFILLLGTRSNAQMIPLVLAWMRELEIKPGATVLSAALVFWEEVSMQAPLIEHWSGGPEKSEYTRLKNWLRDWVGEKGLPVDQQLHSWRLIVDKLRGGSRWNKFDLMLKNIDRNTN